MKFAPVLIPIIKNLTPERIAADICSVQPMQSEAATIYKAKRREPRQMWYIEPVPRNYHEPRVTKQGAKRHESNRGWTVYYGTEWIPESVWWKIKIGGL